jgi:hypothetical protein
MIWTEQSTMKCKYRGMPVAMKDGRDTSLQCTDHIKYSGTQRTFQCNGFKMYSFYEAYLYNQFPENSCVLWCDAMSLNKWFVTYWTVFFVMYWTVTFVMYWTVIFVMYWTVTFVTYWTVIFVIYWTVIFNSHAVQVQVSGCFTFDSEDTMILQNVKNNLPDDTVSHPRRCRCVYVWVL